MAFVTGVLFGVSDEVLFERTGVLPLPSERTRSDTLFDRTGLATAADTLGDLLGLDVSWATEIFNFDGVFFADFTGLLERLFSDEVLGVWGVGDLDGVFPFGLGVALFSEDWLRPEPDLGVLLGVFCGLLVFGK